MKKIILPIIFLLTVALFLSSKAGAQTGEECAKTRARASYNCLTGWTKCFYPCTDQTKDVSACYKTCKQSEDACNKQVDADYKVCLAAKPKTPVISEAEKQPTSLEKERQEGQSESSEVKKETPKFIGFTEIANKFSVETVTVTFLDSKDPNKFKIEEDSDVPQDIKELFEKFKPMTNEEFQRLWNSKPDDLAADEDKKVQKWNDESGAVMSASSWENIKFKEPIRDGKTQEVLRMVEIDQGQLEVKLKESDRQNKFGVQGDFFDLFVIQTHFLVSTSQDKKSAIIAVYEGEIEVKTKDGKTVKVKPEGDKPGVVVISQKLSVVKVAVIGAALAGIAGGIVWFIKRKKKK